MTAAKGKAPAAATVRALDLTPQHTNESEIEMEHITQQINGQSNEAMSRLRKKQEMWTDDYIGTAEDLVAAGLLRPHQFPGSPGMPSTSVVLWHGASRAERGGKNAPRTEGRIDVYRTGRKFRVSVFLDRAIGEARRDAQTLRYSVQGKPYGRQLVEARKDQKLQAFMAASIAMATMTRSRAA